MFLSLLPQFVHSLRRFHVKVENTDDGDGDMLLRFRGKVISFLLLLSTQ